MISERTQRIFQSYEKNSLNNIKIGGAGGISSLEGLKRLDQSWFELRNGGWKKQPPQIVENCNNLDSQIKLPNENIFDVVVCGGTLGIFYALSLVKKGYKVGVIERNKIAGREQEWNISRKELLVLVKLDLINMEELEEIIGIEFNPVRVGFKFDTSTPQTSAKGFETYIQDILNLGIKPDKLIQIARNRFISLGGSTIEDTALQSIKIFNNLAEINIQSTNEERNSSKVMARIVLDAMGNASPIVKQIRGPVEPDGICVVVGGCARGFNPSNNTYSDVIYTDTPITSKSNSKLQYFWESFPAGSSKEDRTTYLFTYMDAKPERPSVIEIMDDYWKLLPRYQGVNLDDLQYLRILYGLFPTYRDSPIRSPFNRILQVGDASGIQSPLSFGGFGSLTRHLERITNSINEALQDDLVTAEDLSIINSYQPNLSAGWMFQRAMSVPVQSSSTDPLLVLGTLINSFSAMNTLGDTSMRPFLQDVIQFTPLLKTLSLAFLKDILTPFKVVGHVGIKAFLDFLYHFVNIGIYTVLYKWVSPKMLASINGHPTMTPRERFAKRRLIESWKFGSGLDFDDHEI